MFLKKILKLSIFSFLFTSTFSWINFFIWNENSYLSWNFSQFSSIIFSLSDLFLFLSVFLFLVFIYQKNSIKSPRGPKILTFFKNKTSENSFTNKAPGGIFNLLFFWLIFSSFLSSFFLENFSNFLLHLSILIKFFSVGFLIFYIPEKIFSKKEILNTLIFSFAIQSFIAFYQVIFQSPVWLFFLWENNFWENILWIAKISLENWENFIRWYWTLAHPNILWLSSLILYFLISKNINFWYRFLKNILIIWIFFSFSKTAIIWFFVLKIYEKIFLNKLKNKKFFRFLDFTFLNKILSNLKSYKFKFFYLFFYSSIFISIYYFFSEKIFTRFQNFFWIWFQERILQLEISKNVIIENIINFNFFWVWFWNFTLQMQNFTNQILKPWEFQPVHNFFILFWTEAWIFWLWILLFLIWYIFIKSEKIISKKIFLILILIFWSFFDHFLLTSSIWIILFWVILKKIKL